ncbi:MAG TPA: hypothetical protein DEG17_17540 [Cyanobacteria bacterium UBA11149]|nr:hypothetical protein [Cyanobacteria bacterium UBA11367]HBE58602.1 hypothetical protein [Cyanobacteria bacterium UBA11366]HBK65801.1 hypothetical protein [Cyanobacteria bacterium UBA11166]HBW90625.1 hypothetical protein [Cyanobacteria bacterium UBA11149]
MKVPLIKGDLGGSKTLYLITSNLSYIVILDILDNIRYSSSDSISLLRRDRKIMLIFVKKTTFLGN